MNEQEKIKALAELDGWKHDHISWYAPDGGRWSQLRSGGREIHPDKILPAYFDSYDAIIPLIQKQHQQIQYAVFSSLKSKPYGENPTQLCDALLIATGKMPQPILDNSVNSVSKP